MCPLLLKGVSFAVEERGGGGESEIARECAGRVRGEHRGPAHGGHQGVSFQGLSEISKDFREDLQGFPVAGSAGIPHVRDISVLLCWVPVKPTESWEPSPYSPCS